MPSKPNAHKRERAVSGRSQRLSPTDDSVTVGSSSNTHPPLGTPICLLETLWVDFKVQFKRLKKKEKKKENKEQFCATSTFRLEPLSFPLGPC